MTQPTLRRELGRWDLTAIGVNQVIGSAIFLLPADVARQVGLRGVRACEREVKRVGNLRADVVFHVADLLIGEQIFVPQVFFEDMNRIDRLPLFALGFRAMPGPAVIAGSAVRSVIDQLLASPAGSPAPAPTPAASAAQAPAPGPKSSE